MLRSRALWKIHSKDHAVAVADFDDTLTRCAVHHSAGRNSYGSAVIRMSHNVRDPLRRDPVGQRAVAHVLRDAHAALTQVASCFQPCQVRSVAGSVQVPIGLANTMPGRSMPQPRIA